MGHPVDNNVYKPGKPHQRWFRRPRRRIAQLPAKARLQTANLPVWAAFFGRQAYTMTLPARLSQQTNATILIAWGERLSWGRGYHVHVRRLPEELPAGAAEAARAVNRAMEDLVRTCPQQYLWGYARYKAPRRDIS